MFFRRGTDIGIDLGTASVLIYIKGQGIVLQEPSIIAIHKKTRQVVAVGDQARRMVGKTPHNIDVIRPLRRGVISDYDATEQMLKYFIQKAIGTRIIKPRIAVCVPSGVTEVEKRAVEDATKQAGARRVDVIEEPIAAAIGAGLDIGKPCGNMVVDIGGGTTDVAVVSLGGGVVERSIKVAGDNLDDAIVLYIRRKYRMLIGESMAESIKKEVGTAYEREEIATTQAKGRDLVTGLPKSVTITSIEMQEALQEPVNHIVETVRNVLELTPPELAADISDRGIVLTGGGGLIYGLDRLIEEHTGIRVIVAEDPISCVAVGTGRFVEYMYDKKRR